MRPDRLLWFAVCAVATGAGLAAQQAGSVRGVVIDKDFDLPLAGAAVQVVEVGRRAVTDDQGAFSIGDLAPGTYSLVVQKEGYVRGFRQVVVAAGRVAEVRFELLGEFTDLEEFVVQDAVDAIGGGEQQLVDMRFDSAAQMDAIGAEMIQKANAGDAAAALRLVAGASTQDGKSAVIRGLPDRYVSSQVNGVLLPSSDEDKRAVELDQFPSTVIESLQVQKTFTPDQQGNASGGAVNVVLRGVPDKPLFFNWKVGTSYNTNVTGQSDYLTYQGGGVHGFGKSGDERAIQEEGTSWDGAVGAMRAEAPDNYKWSMALGGKVELGDGWRAGGFTSFFYDRSASGYRNGRDESRQIGQVGNLMSPQVQLGTVTQPPFFTSLLKIDTNSETVRWGGLSTVGIASDDHSVNLVHMFSRIATDTVTVAEDTQGKHYFFPGHDPDDPTSPGYADGDSAAYTRQQTLAYVERGTDTLQLNGRHRWRLWSFGPLRRVEVDWAIAQNRATRDTPDRREFGSYWDPVGVYRQLKPAAEFTLGNLQRTFITIEEESEEYALNVALPFELPGGEEAVLKFGHFQDRVDRTFRQETFSNFNDPNNFYVGQFDEIDWSQAWLFEEHLISGAETDVDYTGLQEVEAQYLMLELPLVEDLRLVGGVRMERTKIAIQSDPEDNATWVPSVDANGVPNFGIAAFPAAPGEPGYDPDLYALANPSRTQDNLLPAIGLVYDVTDELTARASYAETLARPTFKELSPVFQQDYIGGPVFIGDPNLEISSVRNIDFRLDYVPNEGALFSVSYFKKVIDKPIEYVEAAQGFTFTKPVNYPKGKLTGFEVELRQDLGAFWSPLEGLGLGGNSTWIDATVRRPDSEVLQFEQFQGVRPKTTRDMTDAPDYLWNLFATYELEATGTSFGVFYTVTGDTLVQGPGPSNSNFIPATYQKAFDSLTVTFAQELGRGVRLSLSAANLTDSNRQQVYRTEYLPEDVVRRDYTLGVTWSLSIGGEVRF